MPYILIVDDDKDFADAVARVLRAAGHAVEVRSDIKSAASYMEERRPDLVILDVMFPGDSSAGFSMARSMHLYSELLKGIPILMLTAINTKFPPLRFSERDIDNTWLPVDAFLEKPVDFAVLTDRVDALLRQAGPASSKAGAKA